MFPPRKQNVIKSEIEEINKQLSMFVVKDKAHEAMREGLIGRRVILENELKLAEELDKSELKKYMDKYQRDN